MPAKYVIDLNTRLLGDDHKCYILFPGQGYRFFEEMRRTNSIFLDVPGFPLGPSEDVSDAKDLVERVTISDRIKEWLNDGSPKDKPPVRDPKDLKGYRSTTAKQQFAGLVRGFLHTLKPGDVVIVPGQSYEHDVLFAEILPTKERHFVEVAHYPGEKIPAWKVKWLKTVPRRKIPGWLEQKIPSPNPLRQIESHYYSQVLDIAYERYFFRGEFVCKFKVGSKEFSALDNFLFQQILLYTSALHESRHEANIQGISEKPIAVVAAGIEFSEDIPDQRIEINSPGHIVVYARNLIPVVAAALMTLSSVAGPDALAAEIVIVNTADNSQISKECEADVHQEVIGDINTMGYARWKELCEIEMQARRRTQIDAGMSATAEPDEEVKP